MRVVHGSAALAPEQSGVARRPLALAIGTFDGVHRGHQELIRITCAQAARRGGESAVLTFWPHPARVFAPNLAPPLISSLARRLELLAAAGADLAIVEPFTPTFAAIDAELFVREVLATQVGARDVVVGYDFTFGRGRRGGPELLGRAGAELGLGSTVIPPFMIDGLACSSTKVREFVREGRMERAALLLGRPFEISGPVVRSAGSTRGVGTATGSIAPEAELLPRPGVYAARAFVLEQRKGASASGRYRATVSVGSQPNRNVNGDVGAQADLTNYGGDLSGQHLRLEILHRLRDEPWAKTRARLVRVGEFGRGCRAPRRTQHSAGPSGFARDGGCPRPRVDLPGHLAAAVPVDLANPRTSFARLAPSTAR